MMIFMAGKDKNVKKYVAGSKFCPKCGSRMASHQNRYSCGKCMYTEWKSKGQ
jgi:small subunit ribosomal protein S27Ae